MIASLQEIGVYSYESFMHFFDIETSRRIAVSAFVFVVMLVAAHSALSQTETVLYSFGIQSRYGATPWGSLIMDKQGNLYGTTEQGGEYGSGTVFELSPRAGENSRWSETVLYSFGSQSEDGVNPYNRLLMDKEGNLFGTTNEGGAHGLGTVFELSPPVVKKGAWTESVLYGFDGAPNDGSFPYAGLIIDKRGNLYGTTYTGGAYNIGTVFELSPAQPGGAWTESVLYGFGNAPDDGSLPYAGLVLDKDGNLYGTTNEGGLYNLGVVFKLSPPAEKDGARTETLLYSFGSFFGDGLNPHDSLILDKEGNLYGTTTGGGTQFYGTVFALSPPGEEGGTWTETLLYSFGSGSVDGAYPFDGLIMDKKGQLLWHDCRRRRVQLWHRVRAVSSW